MKVQNHNLEKMNGRTHGSTDKPKPICSPLFLNWGHPGESVSDEAEEFRMLPSHETSV